MQVDMRALQETPSYTDLFVQVKPHTIRTRAEAEAILHEINQLGDRVNLSDGEWEFLALLADILSVWQARQIPVPNLPVACKVRSFLESHGLRQKDVVGSVFATESVASDVLRGKCRLMYDHVETLAAFFHVSPSVFYPPTPAIDPPNLSTIEE